MTDHVHSWVWDGIGGRCACGADITNEEAAMSDHATWCHAHPMSDIGPCNCEINQPDAFIAERLAMEAEIERLTAEALSWWDISETHAAEITRLTASLTTARADALEEAAKIVDRCNREGPYNAIGAASRIRALLDSPTGASAEKTIPGSPEPQMAPSAPLSASTEPFDYDYTYRGVKPRTPYREF